MAEGIEYLAPEIANEGYHAESFAEWAPAVEEARVPDYSWLKGTKFAKYFPKLSGRPYQHQTFPCWLYHPKHEPRLIRDLMKQDGPDDAPTLVKKAVDIARELGCEYRASTQAEIAQGFPPNRWVIIGDWRPTPYEKDKKFNPSKPDTGKHFVSTREPAQSNHDMIGGIVAAVMAQMQTQPAAPAQNNDPDWIEYQAFKKWKEAMAAGDESVPAPGVNALSDLDERQLWEEEAKAKGIRVDGRWSLERLKAEVEKA